MTTGNYGFWLFNGKNGLEGAESTFVELPDGRTILRKDPDHPAVLEDDQIAYALRTSRQARDDFNRLFPTLETWSQERLTALILQNPRATSLLRDDQNFLDAVMHESVTEGVRTKLSTRVKQIAVEWRLKQNAAARRSS